MCVYVCVCVCVVFHRSLYVSGKNLPKAQPAYSGPPPEEEEGPDEPPQVNDSNRVTLKTIALPVPTKKVEEDDWE